MSDSELEEDFSLSDEDDFSDDVHDDEVSDLSEESEEKAVKKKVNKSQRKALDKLETELAVGKGARKVTPAKDQKSAQSTASRKREVKAKEVKTKEEKVAKKSQKQIKEEAKEEEKKRDEIEDQRYFFNPLTQQEKAEVSIIVQQFATESIKTQKIDKESLAELIEKNHVAHPKENSEFFVAE